MDRSESSDTNRAASTRPCDAKPGDQRDNQFDLIKRYAERTRLLRKGSTLPQGEATIIYGHASAEDPR
ncbi:hypothetical protein I5L01_13740 [Erythrobacter sp. YJ-T3-07]|uniref:hypothetical protein n=1 Tax=Erythrobacter sp. YJ-T3-07 TaxID=2793063 RepID=UPI0018D29A18|nr:hypothetical protein [Erythrobacter sp. YJ-T3-07]MBH1945286.1 hypothetical protein [Erythrobacter sp. YJ-T3-07]